MRITSAGLALGAACLPGLLAAPIAANAQSGAVQVRVAYLAPASGNADVSIDGTRTLSNAAYKTISTYMQLARGPHEVTVTAPGGAALLKARVTISPQDKSTIAIGGKPGRLEATPLSDQFATPAPGQAEARFVHMACDVSGVDVAAVDGPVVFKNVAFGQSSPYQQWAAGTYDLQLRASGTHRVLFTAAGVTLLPGSVTTFTGIGGAGRPVQLLPLVDAAGMQAVPSGGADMGAGGTAAPEPAGLLPAGIGLLALLLLAATVLVARRRAT
jgi:hypothetical protein